MENLLNDEFRSLMRRHRNIVRNYLCKLGLYIGQPRVLFYLEDNPEISQKELSENLDVSKEATSVSIRRLEKGGFIIREECQNDRRVKLLKLSDQGERVVKDLRLNFDEINSFMFTDLNDKDKDEFKRILTIMNNSLEKRLKDEEII